jgi:hypothetical protein
VSDGGAAITGAVTVNSASGITVSGTGGLTVSGNIVMANNRVTGAADPQDSQDVVTLAYAEANFATAGSSETVVVATAMTSNAYDAFDIENSNVIYFANTANGGSTALTATLNQGTTPAPTNGQRLFIAWTAKGGTQTSLAVSFASNKLYDAEGAEKTTLTFTAPSGSGVIGGSALLYYSTAGTGHWHLAYAGATLS